MKYRAYVDFLMAVIRTLASLIAILYFLFAARW